MSHAQAARGTSPPAASGTEPSSPAVMGTYARQDIVFARGEGAWLYTEDGTRYLDFGSGVAVNALGHAHPRLVAALTEQAHKLWHTSNLYRVAGQETLADRLAKLTFADKAFFCNSGAEACEGAIKIARRYHYVSGRPERTRIITLQGAFHGRTLATLAAGGNEKYLEGFAPKADGFDQVPFGDLEALKSAIGPDTAAIMVEPIQGEGGVTPATVEFLQGLRRLCDEKGLLLILDEVQCGYARTGKMWAYEHYGITPDILASAKGIGAGFPLGACLATEEAAKGMVFGTHGSTYGGNPLAMAAGEAVLSVIQSPGFMENVNAMGERLRAALEQMIPNHDAIFDCVRGKGLMLGLRLKFESRDFVAHLRDNHGLLTVSAGDNVVRILPPLVIDESHVAECISRLSAGAASYQVPA